MICPHCGDEHPPFTSFCPKTGQPIAPPAQPGAGSLPVALPVPGPDAEPLGILAILQRAAALYARHWLPLVLTCAVVLLPLGLIGDFAQRAFKPDDSKVAAMKERAERIKARNAELADRTRPLREKVLRGSTAEEKAAARQELTELEARTAKANAEDEGAARSDVSEMLSSLMGMLLVLLVVVPLQTIGSFLAQAAVLPWLTGRPMSPHLAWQSALRRLGALAVTAVGAGLSLFFGFLLCLVPGVVLLFLFALAVPVVVLEDKSSVDALRRSGRLVRDHFFRALVLMLVYLLVIIGSEVLLGRLGGWFGTVLPRLAAAVVFPFPTLALLLLYFDIRRVDEGVQPQQLFKVLDSE